MKPFYKPLERCLLFLCAFFMMGEATYGQPDALSASITIEGILCEGADSFRVTITGKGGVPPYRVSRLLNPGDRFNPPDTVDEQPAPLIAYQAADTTYYYYLTDSVGNSFEIGAAPNSSNQLIMGVSEIHPILCTGDSAEVRVQAAFGVRPYTGTGIFKVPAGIHVFEVIDKDSCIVTDTIEIIDAAIPLVLTASSTSVICNNTNTGTATVNATGGNPGYTYLWSPGGDTTATATHLGAGTYVVTVTDANNCTATDTVIVIEPLPVAVTTAATAIPCNGGTADISASASGGTPGYTYAWSPGGATTDTVFGVTPGTYVVTATDANGCEATSSVTVTEPTAVMTTVSYDTILINGGTTDLTANPSGGTPDYTYAWSNGDITATVTVPAGTYTVVVTDANGCPATVTVTLDEPEPLVVEGDLIPIPCNGDSSDIVISAKGGVAPYTGTGVFREIAGTYTCVVTDANGATDSVIVTLDEPSGVEASASASSIACNGGTADMFVSASGGTQDYTYQWSNGATTDTVTGVRAGTYVVTVTDANGCEAVDSVTVTEPTAVMATVSYDPILINGGTTDLTANPSGGTPGYTYQWSPGGDMTATITVPAGTYTVIVTDANGCTDTVTVNLVDSEPALPIADVEGCGVVYAGAGIAYACATLNGSAADGIPDYTYSWSNGETTPSITVCPDSTTTYTLTVTDANGSSVSVDWTVMVVDISCVTSCEGGSGSVSSGSGSDSGTDYSNSSSYSYSSCGGTLNSGPACPSNGEGSGNTSESSMSGSSMYGSSMSEDNMLESGSSSLSSSSNSSFGSCHLLSDGYSSCDDGDGSGDGVSSDDGGYGSSSSSNSSSFSNSNGIFDNGKVLMCFDGVTYCVSAGHVDKKLGCGYTLGPCDAQQPEACNNTPEPDTTANNCVCTGGLTSITVRYLGASGQDLDIFAKKCSVPITSITSANTGDVFVVNAVDGGLSYLRNHTYFRLTGTDYGHIRIPTSCCNNPIGRIFFPFEVIGWTDTDGNVCDGSLKRRANNSIAPEVGFVEKADVQLTQYPNPAENHATFEFSVTESANVSLSVLNLSGKVIGVLFDGNMKAAQTYTMTFDVTHLQSGIYFARLITPNGIIKKKFVVLK